MCKVLEVSRSGFYSWLKRDESSRARANRELTAEIREIHLESQGIYGAPRIHAVLQYRGHKCGLNRVASLMQKAGIFSKTRRRFRVRTTDSNHSLPIAPNLVERDFTAEKPDQLWVADITYIPTGEGWLFLAAIIDVYSRRVVGWAMEPHMHTSLVMSALNMALGSRQPGVGLVHHSDRGSQYASKEHRRALETQGIRCSMSRKGDCYDNALMESFFHSLKVEWIYDEFFATRREAKAAIFEYLEIFYNRVRLHSSLGYVSPVEFETAVA